MGEETPSQPQSFVTEVRGLAPGFLVGFARPFVSRNSENTSDNRARFPHIAGLGLADAEPDLLAFVAALSAADDRTVEETIETTADRLNVDRKRLRRFANNLNNTGYLVENPPPARWPGAPVVVSELPFPLAGDEWLFVPEASSLVVDGGDFLWFDHDGDLRLRLTVEEMSVTRLFGEPHTADSAWDEASEQHPPVMMSRAGFDELLARLHASGLLQTTAAVDHERNAFAPVERNSREIIFEATLEAVAEFRETVMARPGRRTAVVPVNDDPNMAPLSLGLLVAYAQELDGGRLKERYDFVPLFLTDDAAVLEFTDQPAIFLFSNYIWNYERNLKLSAMLKQANPAGIMIHGGPSTPKYTADCIEFFVENPHVDVTVRGEGEATFAALLDALDENDLTDLSVLESVAGLSFRGPNGVVDSEDRDRIADLDTIPSPYLLGLFDAFGKAHSAAVVESNRGCPYGCTFCDWGSATLSRIRKFDMDRVKGELEWFSKNELLFVSLCDANFGIFERDVEIAEYIGAMKTKYGYPKTAALNYAKNTMKHLRKIIKIFSDAGLTIEPTVALQTTDVATLKVVRRSNIKLSQYDELADGFRRAGLPLATDVMMGLPGATLEAFRGDLQACTDRDVRARCNPTVLLPNSPMNDPAYREEHGIKARPHEIIMESNTYTREDFDEMNRIRLAFYVFDNFGVLRQVARYVRSETAMLEVEFYDRLSRAAVDDPLRWPLVAALIKMMSNNLAPPASWQLFLEEVKQFVVTELGIEPGSALDTVFEVQLGHLPAPARVMPQTLHLAHDYVAWHDAMLTARSEHRDDWDQYTPRLATFPPGEIKISDPGDVCGTMVGKSIVVMAWSILGWDMDSPVSRGQLVAAAG